jgi:hypothetical protein
LNALNTVVTLTDKVLQNGRFRGATKGAETGDFDLELLPKPLRMLPDSVNAFASKMVNKYFLSKYGNETWTMESAHENMRQGLRALNDIRIKNGGAFLIGNQLSLADIIACTAFLPSPLPNGFSRLGPTLSKLWEEPELAEEFKDFLEWRNSIYIQYRGEFQEKEGKGAKKAAL